MDNKQVEPYKSKIVSGQLAIGESEFTAQINIPFHVDELVLKTLTVANNGNNNFDTVFITSDLNNYETLITYPGCKKHSTRHFRSINLFQDYTLLSLKILPVNLGLVILYSHCL
eukprot:Lithocolla_globosa_v1_NODE_12257_length_437_cov_16.660714.p1 type:complete len:114 gc:universal NODE_12257_length_437_cov_16.660714:402-61(-)